MLGAGGQAAPSTRAVDVVTTLPADTAFRRRRSSARWMTFDGSGAGAPSMRDDGCMRLWSLHPRHLDRQGLTGCWRESLLAQAVLAGRTRGYRAHPQLERFRAHSEPVAAVGAYLAAVAQEATERGYRFDLTRIDLPPGAGVQPAPIPVTDGQLALEWTHLLAKLERRSPVLWEQERQLHQPEVHPLFEVIPGLVES